ncbi:MAG: glutathione S-transferase N-terminal domain-containing protein [Burkholderiaceae bacterium]|nr:glutathione S-transferase N-terminal domain-containing protein [Burkholderiaceae bacterium]
MIDLYYWPTPNGWKISIMLEECALPYRVVPVNIGRGEQFEAPFLAISPNNRMPAIVDHDPPEGKAPLSVFESGAILLYLAHKTQRFLPQGLEARVRAIEWLMWQMGGMGPMLGQNGHFLLYADQEVPYAIERYAREARRLYGVLDRQLALTGAFVAGEYSIADFACFPWIMTHKRQGISLDDFPSIARWFATMRAREAVQRGLAVGADLRIADGPMDEQARRILFGQGSEARQPVAAAAPPAAGTARSASPAGGALEAAANGRKGKRR